MDIIELSKIIDNKGIFDIVEATNSRSKTEKKLLIPRITMNSPNIDLMNELVKHLNGKFKKYGSYYKMTFDGTIACERVMMEILPFLEKKSTIAITMMDFIDFCKRNRGRDMMTYVEKREFKKRIDDLNQELRAAKH